MLNFWHPLNQVIYKPKIINPMPTQLYTPFQSLRIETDKTKEKAYLISSLQCWVCQYQYLKINDVKWLSDSYLEIALNVPNTASSQTEILWSGEQKVEIPFLVENRQIAYTVHAFLLKKPEGGVTNTISGNGGTTIPI
jgi:hypothetical protein